MHSYVDISERIFNADISSNAKPVMFALVYHANKHTGIAFPKQELIAAEVSLKDRQTVGKALKELEEKGLIKCIEHHGRGKIYQLLWEDGSPITEDTVRERAAKRAADAGESVSRCRRHSHLMTKNPSADDGETLTNRSNEHKNEHKTPTKTATVPSGRGMEDAIYNDGAKRMFDEFWTAYPDSCHYKTGLAECRQRYAKLLAESGNPSGLHAKVLDSLAAWKLCEQWNKEDGKYICSPGKWLDRGLWEESPSPSHENEQRMKKKATQVYNWELCEEKCANCTGNGCKVGVKVPPNFDEVWPRPPEECEHFNAVAR